jgi:hypothetical protein
MRGISGDRLLQQLRGTVAPPEVHHATAQAPQQERVSGIFSQELLVGIASLIEAASLFELMELLQLYLGLV